MSPLAKYLLPVTPMPTISGINPFNAPNYVGQWSPRNRQWTGATRVDHKIGERDSFYASTGFLSTRDSGQGARTLQLSLRFTW